MLNRLGRLVARRPWLVVGLWVLATAALLPVGGSLGDHIKTDDSDFLPGDMESVQALELSEDAFPEAQAPTALGVVQRADGAALTEADAALVTDLARELHAGRTDGVTAVATGPEALAPDRTAQLVQVTFAGDVNDESTVLAFHDLRDAARAAFGAEPSLTVGFTGEIAAISDADEAFASSQEITLLVTIGLIVVLLLAIFRSPLAALLPILAVALVTVVATGAVAVLAGTLDLPVSQQVQIILPIVLFGVGTDYVVFLLFRYRERLRAGDPSRTAVAAALGSVGAVVLSAGLTTAAAFTTLALSLFGQLRSVGPALAVGILVMMAAGVTLVPALVAIMGTKVFWPSRSWRRQPRGKLAGALGSLTARRPVLLAAGAVVVLAVLATGALGIRFTFDNGGLPEDTESYQAQQAMVDAGFPVGAADPTLVVVHGDQPLDEAALAGIAERLGQVGEVDQVAPPEVSADGTTALLPVLLTHEPETNPAIDAVAGPVREAAHAAAPAGATVAVGGTTSVLADVLETFERDVTVIFPVAGAMILLILVVLLRSLVAPLYLMLAVTLGFLATLGATTWVFQDLQEMAGVSFQLPLLMFLFVVALGSDYNIMMITRLREEAEAGKPARQAVRAAVAQAAPPVAAAGLLLAAAFASFMLAEIGELRQLGFALSLGIALAAFVMSPLLVPALTALFGRAAWWPRRLRTMRPRAGTADAPGIPPERRPVSTPTSTPGGHLPHDPR